MRTIPRLFISLALIALSFTSAPASDFWISGYYPGWDQTKLSPGKIPFNAITHLFHFSLVIQADGSLSTTDAQLSESHIKATVQAAHTAGKKVLIVLGGADSEKGFQSATSEKNRSRFINNIVAFTAKHYYDGVDIDWEILRKEDNRQYALFVKELHAALKQNNPEALLTAATGPNYLNTDIGKLFAGLQDNFDQINLMTYVLSGAWEGWISWFGSPLTNGGGTFPNGRGLPSIESNMNDFVSAGVRKEKLGLGLAFHGDVWTGGSGTTTGGVTQPRQTWETPPAVRSDLAYSEIMEKYFSPARYRFDEATQTPYLSIDEPGSKDDHFISYSDAFALTVRLNYLKKENFGGCIIWQLCQDVMPSGEQPLTLPLAAFLAREKKTK